MAHLRDSKPKAAKKHRCYLCGWDILKGAKHALRVGVHDGDFSSTRMHLQCEELTTYWKDEDWEFHDSGEFRQILENAQQTTNQK